MTYAYYPGCSLEGSAREYDTATRALMAALDVDLVDIPDWTCCGASAAEAISELLSLALPARNLALAESMDSIRDILVPCSACYLNLKRVDNVIRHDPEQLARINSVLEVDQLMVKGASVPRHLLDILSRDIGSKPIFDRVTRNLGGLRIAPYYGCQCIRPFPVFDDPEAPRSMEPLIEACGATVYPWTVGGRCCGAAHMNTKPDVGTALVSGLLEEARGADAVVTVCPMCQMNLEAYQRRVSRAAGSDLRISILYLPQLLGLAMGLSEKELGLGYNLAITDDFRRKLNGLSPAEERRRA